jgi:hypothetical protein
MRVFLIFIIVINFYSNNLMSQNDSINKSTYKPLSLLYTTKVDNPILIQFQYQPITYDTIKYYNDVQLLNKTAKSFQVNYSEEYNFCQAIPTKKYQFKLFGNNQFLKGISFCDEEQVDYSYLDKKFKLGIIKKIILDTESEYFKELNNIKSLYDNIILMSNPTKNGNFFIKYIEPIGFSGK